MADHGGGGGGGGAGFFLALFAAVAVAWFFAEMQKQNDNVVDNEPAVTESVFDETPMDEVGRDADSAWTPLPLQEGHGMTYYLDEDGNILDVVHF